MLAGFTSSKLDEKTKIFLDTGKSFWNFFYCWSNYDWKGFNMVYHWYLILRGQKKTKKLKHSITRILPIFNFQWLKQKAKSMEKLFG